MGVNNVGFYLNMMKKNLRQPVLTQVFGFIALNEVFVSFYDTVPYEPKSFL